jgi:WD40 repeat protein
MITVQPYQVGGSLQEASSTYVPRQADRDLYLGLKSGLFCYVLNSRQMGKSSLRVRTMSRLRSDGYRCIAFEMRELCLQGVTADEFYGGFVSHLANALNLTIDLSAWWTQHELFHPFLRLNQFVEEVLLRQVEETIVIFIDEVDTILTLEFKDDFFAFLRSCYNKRSDKPEFQRLNFALFGVATPIDLIDDQSVTPWNIESRSIELTGFTLEEAQPLEIGFIQWADRPTAVMAAILDWTGGQPFLTQWVCQMLYQTLNITGQSIALGLEVQTVETIVRQQIIESWMTQDRQQHFQTIRDRILNHSTFTVWALGLYQQLLNQGEMTIADGPELMQFRLSGLVYKRQNKVFIYNRIYRSIFDQTWTKQVLRQIRPYGAELSAWEAGQRQSQYLLTTEPLQAALDWAEGLSLSQVDYQYLSASQAQQLQFAQVKTHQAAEQEAQAIQRLTQVQHQTKKWTIIGFGILMIALGSTIAVYLSFRHSNQLLQDRSELQALEQAAARLLQSRSDATQIPDLLTAIQSATKLKQIMQTQRIAQPPTYAPIFALQEVLGRTQQHNSWNINEGTSNIDFSADGKTIVTGDFDGTLTLWNLQGQILKSLRPQVSSKNQSDPILHVDFHPSQNQVVALSLDNQVSIVETIAGKVIHQFSPPTPKREKLRRIVYSNDGKSLIGVTQRGLVLTLTFQGELLRSSQIFDRKLQRDSVSFFSFATDQDAILFRNDQNQPEVRDIITGNVLKRYPKIKLPENSMVRHHYFHHDQRYVSTDSNMLNIWNSSGLLISSLNPSQFPIQDFSYSPDRTLMAILTGNAISLWKTDQQGLLTPAFNQMAKGYYEPPMDFYSDLQKPPQPWAMKYKAIPERSKPPEASQPDRRINQVILHPQQDLLIYSRNNGQIAIQDLGGNTLQQFESALKTPQLTIDASGTYLFLISKNQKVLQIRQLNGDLIKTIPIKPAWDFFTVSPDGKTVAIAGKTVAVEGKLVGTIEIYDIKGQLLQTLTQTQQVHFISNHEFLSTPDIEPSTNSQNRSIFHHHLHHKTKKILFNQQLKNSWTHIFSNAYLMEIGEDNNVILYDPSGKVIQKIKPNSSLSGNPESVNGQFFGMISQDRRVTIWNHSGAQIRSFVRTGFTGQDTAMVLNPTGDLLASKTRDGKVSVWQSDGQLIYSADLGGSMNNALTFSRDGNAIVATDGIQIHVLNLNLESLLKKGCLHLEDYFARHPKTKEQLGICLSP